MTDDTDFSFTEFISDHDHGTVAQLLSDRMQRVVRACIEHKGNGKAKGNVVLRLDIEKAGDGRAQITASIKSTEPQPGSASHTYFAGDNGTLHTENPRQTSMPAKVLGEAPIRFPGGKA